MKMRIAACLLVVGLLCPLLAPHLFPSPAGRLDDAWIDADGRVYLACSDADTLALFRFESDGTPSGSWSTRRYDGYDYFQIDSVRLDTDGLAVCQLSRFDSRDYSLRGQTWIKPPFSANRSTIVGTAAGEDSLPLGFDMGVRDDRLTSLALFDGHLRFTDVASGERQIVPLDSFAYVNRVCFLSYGRAAVSNTAGEIRVYSAEGYEYTAREGGKGAVAKMLACGGGVVWYDLQTASWIYADQDGEKPAALPGAAEVVRVDPDGHYLTLTERGTACLYDGGAAIELSLPSMPRPHRLIISALAGLLPAALYCAYLLLKRVRVSLLLKLVGVTAASLALGVTLLAYQLGGTFAQNHERAKTIEALNSARKMAASIDLSQLAQIDWSHPDDSEYFDELYSLLTYSSEPVSVNKLLPEGQAESEDILSNAYFSLLIYRDGQLITGVSDTAYSGIPANFVCSDNLLGQYTRLCQDPTLPAVLAGLDDSSSNWLSVAVALVSPDATAAGVLEAGFSLRQYSYEREQAVRGVVFQLAAVTGVAALALAVCISIALASLGRLRYAVEAIENGDFSTHVPVKGRDEIAGIAAAFNNMSSRIESHTRGLEQLNSAYARFLPREVLSALGTDSVLSVRRGQHKYIETVVLSVHLYGFDETIGGMEPCRVFEYVNAISGAIIDIVLRGGGFVEKYSQSQYICLFEEPDGALAAAIQISRALSALAPAPRITQALVRGKVLLGVAGHDKRLGTLTISEILHLSAQMCERGVACGAQIVYTPSSAPSHPCYNRYIGSVSFEGREVELYECYEGDGMALFRSKLEHGGQFERAVRLIERGETEQARAELISYVRACAPDEAARYFLSLCRQ